MGRLFYRVICGDCLEVMPTLDPESFALVVADPPFNVHEKPLDRLEPLDWDVFPDLTEYARFTVKWLTEVHRLLEPGGSCYVFWSQRWERLFYCIADCVLSRLDPPLKLVRELAWVDYCQTWRFTSRYYLWNRTPVFYLVKSRDGKPKTFNASFMARENVDTFVMPAPQSNWRKDRQYHPFQKPLRLVEIFVKNSSNPGDAVLDPFLGAGTTMLACIRLGRSCVGIEKSPEYCRIAQLRAREMLARLRGRKPGA
ncbi:hypothetical protein DRO33_05170 [Candidatus Bathyarchaeota archaeon]|nr:MAG: hypothetical protein DRO33_05170 [Candidatus Bathyarchaeota archaeon]